MFPLYDSSPTKRIPYVNWLLILINVIVFVIQVTRPDFDAFIHTWGFIPILFDVSDQRSWLYIFTSMFMHASILHIASNLWFLHIFGDNVEDRLGHLAYLLFYLMSGIAATLAQYFLIQQATIPLIGASGAISGVAGAYILFQFRSTIVALLPLGALTRTVRLPAWIFLGYWFLLQLLMGVGELGQIDYNRGGTAWFAHVGGFVFGLGMGLMLKAIIREPRE